MVGTTTIKEGGKMSPVGLWIYYIFTHVYFLYLFHTCVFSIMFMTVENTIYLGENIWTETVGLDGLGGLLMSPQVQHIS